MAWANVRTYGLLERWRKRLLQQEYPFQQINDGFDRYSPAVWIQQERNELAQTLLTEVENFNFWVGYAPFPTYFEETVYFNDNVAWYNQSLLVDNGKLIQFGKEAKELLGTATVAFVGDTATVTLADVSPITAGDLAFVFTTDDGAEEAGDLRYQIHDLIVTHDGTDYVATGHKSLFVKPSLQSPIDSFVNGNPDRRNELDKDSASTFVDTVEVYRVYNDTTLQAELLSLDYSTQELQTTSVTPIITNADFGEFRLSTATGIPNYTPYAVKVYYQAGKERQTDGNVFTPFENIIIRRAKVHLPLNVEEVSYRVSANWESDEQSIFATNAPNYYANPIGDKIVDYYTWQIYQIYHDKHRGQARRFV